MPPEIPNGAVVLARAILESSIWGMKSDDIKVALTMIALANFQPAKWHDGRRWITIKKGEFIRSRKGLAKKCQLPVQVVRTCCRNLANAKDEHGIPFLVITSTSRWTRWKLPKYPFYQDLSNYEDKANPTSNPTSRLPKINQPIHENQPADEAPDKASKPPSKPRRRTRKPSIQPALSGKTTSKTRKTNHKQEQQQQECIEQEASPPSPPKTVSQMIDDYDRQGAKEHAARQNVSSTLLNQVSIRRGVLLLLSVGVKEPAASSLAGQRSIGELIDVVQEARTKERPGGFVIRALERGWGIPIHEAARAEILADLESDRTKADAAIAPLNSPSAKYAQLPGESDRDWMARGMKLKRNESTKKA